MATKIQMQAEKKQKAERESSKPKRTRSADHYQTKQDDRPMPSQSAIQEKAYAEKHRLVVKGKVTIHKCL